MTTAIVMLLVFLVACILSWLVTKRIVARWKRSWEPTERFLAGVCVFGVVFFVLGGLAIGALSIYRQFTHEVVSAVAETADAIEDVKERALSEEAEQEDSSPAGTQMKELQDKITKWQTSRDKLKDLLEQLKRDKASVLEKLDQLGISSDDFVSNPKAQILSDELKEILRQTAICEKRHEDYDLAVLKSETRVRTLARRLEADAGVGDSEIAELAQSIKDLDESLTKEDEGMSSSDLEPALAAELSRFERGQQASSPSPMVTPASDAPQSPTTVAEPPVVSGPDLSHGFVSLFDGQSLNGWQGDLQGYTANGGILTCQQKGGKLLTDKEYSDFILRLEYRLEPGANNGVLLRAPLTGDPSEVVEVQIIDDSHPKFRNWLKPIQRNGSVYGVVPAKPGHAKPAGEWNSEEIDCQGSHFRVILNGAVIVDADSSTISGQTLKGKPHPALRRTSGYIGFTGHGSRVEFRNIRIKELTGTAPQGRQADSLVARGPISARTSRMTSPEVVSVKPISLNGKCCDATDLVFFNGRWICAFREGSAYTSPDGFVRVIESLDGDQWKPAGVVRLVGYDLRGPKFCVTPKSQLMLSFAATKRQGTKTVECLTHVSLSTDGREWSAPVAIGEPLHWIYDLCWDRADCYGAGYFVSDPKAGYVRLFCSKNAKKLMPLVGTLYSDGSPTESAMQIESQGNAVCLIRRGGDHPAALGLAKRPFTEWTWKALNMNVAGPDIAQLPDGRYIVAGRLDDGRKRTALCWLDIEKAHLTEFLSLPSGGTNGYPGMALHGNDLWVSYFSSHEQKTRAYVARVRLFE